MTHKHGFYWHLSSCEQSVQGYIKDIQEIRGEKENQTAHIITEKQNIEKVVQSVVQATEKSTSQITNKTKKDLRNKPVRKMNH